MATNPFNGFYELAPEYPRGFNSSLSFITPFTHRTNISYAELLFELYKWLREKHLPELDKILKDWQDQYQIDFENLKDDIDSAKDEWENLFNQFMADVVSQLEALNDQAVANLVNNELSLLKQALNANFLQKDELFINVSDYVTPDGVSDNTQGIQNAFNAVSDKAAIVVFEPKNYVINGTGILPKTGVTILGNHATLNKRTPGTVYAFFASKSDGATGYGSGINGLHVTDLIFKGEFTNSPDTGRRGCAFALHHAKNVLVDSCQFIEMAGRGHVFDLNGCDGVVIRNSLFEGFQVEDGKQESECIQLDQSKNGSLSSADTPGSYDGLMTRNVLIDNCKFVSLVKNGVMYFAPNPLGSHTIRQGKWYENIIFSNNEIYNPQRDWDSEISSSSYTGTISLIGVRNVKILNNTWHSDFNKEDVLCIAFYADNKGNAVGQDPNIVQSVEPIPTQAPRDIMIMGNTFRGFKGLGNVRKLTPINLVGMADGFIEDVTISGNHFIDLDNGGTALPAVSMYYVDGASVIDNHARNVRRFVHATDSKRVSANRNTVKTCSSFPILDDAGISNDYSGNQISLHASPILIRDGLGITCNNNNMRAGTADPSGASGGEITLQNVNGFSVNGNVFVAQPAKNIAITLSGTTDNGRAENNICLGYPSAVWLNTTGENTAISPNTIAP